MLRLLVAATVLATASASVPGVPQDNSPSPYGVHPVAAYHPAASPWLTAAAGDASKTGAVANNPANTNPMSYWYAAMWWKYAAAPRTARPASPEGRTPLATPAHRIP